VADPFVAEIRIVPFNFAPRGWAICSGQILSISQNTALFSLLGTTYGGNGTTNFALPNFQGNLPLFWGQGPGLSNRQIGEMNGSPTVTLQTSELASHSHNVYSGAGAPSVAGPLNAALGSSPARHYAAGATNTTMHLQAVQPAGNGIPHNNLSPYLVLNFVIALQGIYPARS
jgi:microcystin-dependent protein